MDTTAYDGWRAYGRWLRTGRWPVPRSADVQQSADIAYEDGVVLFKAGKLRVRLSEQEVLGNYVYKEVRNDLKQRYGL